tara:strand:- start:1872 stop:3686 length:1815 start_codon:yes stop_codon:yes gene_type:complete
MFAQVSTSTFVSILLNTSGIPYVYVYNGGSSVGLNSQVALTLNQWEHLAVTWEASSSTLLIYINGVQATTASGGSSSTGSSGLMTIGSRTDGSQNFAGELDEFRIWSEARTACKINAAMYSEFTTSQPNLIAYYNFNQGTAGGTNTSVTTLNDFTTTYNGTLTNFALTGTSSNWLNSSAPITQANQTGSVLYGVANIAACDSYTWTNGVTYTANNNTAIDTVASSGGCDSIVTLNLTITSSSASTDVVSACDSYTWIDGNTYTSSNTTATHTLTNTTGCDSVITLDLTILNASASTDVVSACGSYTWMDGNTYSTSNNTATYTLTNAIGCDSVITLDLTILNASASTDVVSACGSYTWIDGNSYSASNNTATYTLTNAAGCDSVVTLDLTILNATASTDVISACESYTWIDGNTYTASNNTATYTLTNAAGCDSVVTLDLTVNAIDVTVTAAGSNALEANASGAVVSYQWYDCNDNAILTDDTLQVYTAVSSGEYAVIVEGTNGCADTSDCVVIIGTGIEKENIDAVALAIYPNPTQGIFTLEFSQEQQNVSVVITNISGQVVEQQTLANGQQFTLELKGSAGVYFCTVSTEDGIHEVIRLIKQ